MSSISLYVPRPAPRRIWPALRGAQALLLLPLGLLQLAAVVSAATSGATAGGYGLAFAAAAAGAAAIGLALLLPRRTHGVRDAATVLLLAQVGLSSVKLTVYGQTAALLVLALSGITWGLVKLDAKLHPSVL
jgi:hypothetical protein